GGDPPGLGARAEKGRRGHGRTGQRQDRLPRPRHDRAVFEVRDLGGARAATREAGRLRPPLFWQDGTMMRTSYDPEADAMFVWFGPEGVKSVKTEEVAPGLMLDFDNNG